MRFSCRCPTGFIVLKDHELKEKLPKVLAREEVLSIIENTNNIKHRCIVSLLYSRGLRRNVVLNLKPQKELHLPLINAPPLIQTNSEFKFLNL